MELPDGYLMSTSCIFLSMIYAHRCVCIFDNNLRTSIRVCFNVTLLSSVTFDVQKDHVTLAYFKLITDLKLALHYCHSKCLSKYANNETIEQFDDMYILVHAHAFLTIICAYRCAYVFTYLTLLSSVTFHAIQLVSHRFKSF